nr:helix-turn-helix transcriptional regulator [Paracoccus saliphilus]
MPRRFYDALKDALDSSGWSIARLCKEADVSTDQITKFMQRAGKGQPASTNVDDAVRLANALGLTLDEMLEDRTAELRSEAADLWRSLTSEEREILRAAARGRHVDMDTAQS